MKTILVTGANGFVGKHLIHELHQAGHTVIGVGGPTGASSMPNSELSEYRVCDLTSPEQVASMDFHGIDSIIHLAGLASAKLSFDQPARFISDNGAISINLFEALMHQNVRPRTIVISSGALYSPDQPMPIGEDGITRASSPYNVSKLLTEDICEYYRMRGIPSLTVRPFNHIGPGQGVGFLLPDLASQIQQAIANHTPITVGNLTTKRDYTDVRDVVRAYHQLAVADAPQQSLYNVCSGNGVAGQYFLNLLLTELTGNQKPEVVVDSNRFRPNDPELIIGSAARISEEFGWKPEIPLEQTVRDFVEEFRSALNG